MTKLKLTIVTFVLSAAASLSVWGGQWKQDTSGWWYQNEDGSYPVSTWYEDIDGKWYYFNESGYMLTDATTPDGYYIGTDGVWAAQDKGLSIVTSNPSTVVNPGTYLVGTDIEAGEYVLFATGEWGAYYEISSDNSGSLEAIISNDNFYYNSIISVSDGEYLELSRCTLSPISEVSQIDYRKGEMFKVGVHLPAGEYQVKSTSVYGGYYEILSKSRNSLNNIMANEIFEGQAYVTVRDGLYLNLSRCSIVK